MAANRINRGGGGAVVGNEELFGERPAEDMKAEAMVSPSRRGFVIGSALAGQREEAAFLESRLHSKQRDDMPNGSGAWRFSRHQQRR